jgi:hypothetical protein
MTDVGEVAAHLTAALMARTAAPPVPEQAGKLHFDVLDALEAERTKRRPNDAVAAFGVHVRDWPLKRHHRPEGRAAIG